MAVSEQQRTFPFPNQKLALTCYQLTVVRGGVGAQLFYYIDPNIFDDKTKTSHFRDISWHQNFVVVNFAL